MLNISEEAEAAVRRRAEWLELDPDEYATRALLGWVQQERDDERRFEAALDRSPNMKKALARQYAQDEGLIPPA